MSSLCSARTWTNTEGKALEGDIVSATESHVEIAFAKQNKNFTIPISSLIQEDREFIAQWKETQHFDLLFEKEWPAHVKAPPLEIKTISEGPEGYIYQSNHYEFISDAKLTKVPVAKFAALFEASRQYLKELPLGNTRASITDIKHKVYLFEQTQDYIKAGGLPNSGGVFISARNGEPSKILVPFQSLGLRKAAAGYRYDHSGSNQILPHEICHQITDRIFYQKGNSGWYTEGLAEYIALTPYNGSTFTTSKVKNELKNYVTGFSNRVGRGRNLGDSFEMPSLENFMNMDYSNFIGEASQLNYSVAALLFTYFAHFEGDKEATNLKNYLKAIKSGTKATEAHPILFGHKTYQEVQEDFAKAWRSRGVRIRFTQSGSESDF